MLLLPRTISARSNYQTCKSAILALFILSGRSTSGSAPHLGCGGRAFDPLRSDQRDRSIPCWTSALHSRERRPLFRLSQTIYSVQMPLEATYPMHFRLLCHKRFRKDGKRIALESSGFRPLAFSIRRTFRRRISPASRQLGGRITLCFAPSDLTGTLRRTSFVFM